MSPPPDDPSRSGARGVSSELALSDVGQLPAAIVPTVPDLSGLTVELSRPQPISEAQLLERLDELRYAMAARRERHAGEAVAEGDDVVVDVITYANGRVAPFGAQAGWRFRIEPIEHLPGFAEALVGLPVGQSSTVRAKTLSAKNDPSVPFCPADFRVTVTSAAEVTLPDPQDAAFLARLGLGATIEEVFERLADQLAEEESARLQVEAMRSAIEALVERARVSVPENLIDLEIGLAWREGEGDVLARAGVSLAERDEDLRAWLRDRDERDRARRRLAATLMLRAVAKHAGLHVDSPEEARAYLAELAGAFHASVPDLERALDADPTTRARTLQRIAHLRAIAHVMERVTVREGR